MSKDYPTLTLNDDRQIPQLGFGTWQIEEDKAADAVSTALETGYWLIDTAAIYKNEKGVGEGIGDWADIFLQTKIWNESQGYDRTLKAADKCLERLGRDHVDMLLIHWPCPDKGLFVETWKAFIELRDQGKAKSIGVSNFREEDLKRIVDETGVVPALNQIELHPSFQQLVAARPGQRDGQRHDQGDRRRDRQIRQRRHHPLAHPARLFRAAALDQSRSHSRQLQRAVVRTERRADGEDRCAGQRGRPDGPRTGQVQRLTA